MFLWIKTKCYQYNRSRQSFIYLSNGALLLLFFRSTCYFWVWFQKLQPSFSYKPYLSQDLQSISELIFFWNYFWDFRIIFGKECLWVHAHMIGLLDITPWLEKIAKWKGKVEKKQPISKRTKMNNKNIY